MSTTGKPASASSKESNSDYLKGTNMKTSYNKVTPENIDSAWQQVWEGIRDNISSDAENIDAFFMRLTPEMENDYAVNLISDTEFVQRWVYRNYISLITLKFYNIYDEYIDVRITCLPSYTTTPIRKGLEVAFEEMATLAARNKEKRIVGIPTGFEALDLELGGIRTGQLSILAGIIHAPDLAINMAINAARAGVRVFYFSMRRSISAIVQDFICLEADIYLGRLFDRYLQERDWQRIASANASLSTLDIHFIDNPSMTCELVQNTIELNHRHKKKVLAIIDDIDSMEAPKPFRLQRRDQQIAAIMQELQKVSVSLDVAILGLSQSIVEGKYFNRERMLPEDIKFAEPIMRYADKLLLLDMNMSSDEHMLDDRPAQNEAWLICEKSRGTINYRRASLHVDGWLGRFSDYVKRDGLGKRKDSDENWEDISYEDLKRLLEGAMEAEEAKSDALTNDERIEANKSGNDAALNNKGEA